VPVLVLLFLIGCGQAFMAPAWYAVQPQLVPPHQLPQAAALNSTSMNIARIVGPIAGASLAQAVGIAGAFMLNALSYVGTTIVFGRWREPAHTLATAAGGRIRDAVRYVWHDRLTVTVLWRLVSFGPVSGVIWPLLPVYARELGADATGYSVLLAAFGAGAGVTAFFLPAVHRVFTQDSVHRWACWVFAAVLLALPAVDSLVLACVLLVPAAFMAIAALATLSAAMQRSLADDMRARGMSIYQILLQGGMGVGGLAWGVLADLSGVRATFAVAAALLLVSGSSAFAIRLDGSDATAARAVGEAG
jgi:predicted MFS family arabinose efflux permease